MSHKKQDYMKRSLNVSHDPAYFVSYVKSCACANDLGVLTQNFCADIIRKFTFTSLRIKYPLIYLRSPIQAFTYGRSPINLSYIVQFSHVFSNKSDSKPIKPHYLPSLATKLIENKIRIVERRIGNLQSGAKKPFVHLHRLVQTRRERNNRDSALQHASDSSNSFAQYLLGIKKIKSLLRPFVYLYQKSMVYSRLTPLVVKHLRNDIHKSKRMGSIQLNFLPPSGLVPSMWRGNTSSIDNGRNAGTTELLTPFEIEDGFYGLGNLVREKTAPTSRELQSVGANVLKPNFLLFKTTMDLLKKSVAPDVESSDIPLSKKPNDGLNAEQIIWDKNDLETKAQSYLKNKPLWSVIADRINRICQISKIAVRPISDKNTMESAAQPYPKRRAPWSVIADRYNSIPRIAKSAVRPISDKNELEMAAQSYPKSRPLWNIIANRFRSISQLAKTAIHPHTQRTNVFLFNNVDGAQAGNHEHRYRRKLDKIPDSPPTSAEFYHAPKSQSFKTSPSGPRSNKVYPERVYFSPRRAQAPSDSSNATRAATPTRKGHSQEAVIQNHKPLSDLEIRGVANRVYDVILERVKRERQLRGW